MSDEMLKLADQIRDCTDSLTRDHLMGANVPLIVSALRAAAAGAEPVASFQKRVQGWMMQCFSMEVCRDRQERNHRFLEEALELVQALGCTANEAHQLVDYVFGRDLGDVNQEVGGVMVTLAALCCASDIDMHQGGEIELARIMRSEIMDKIRAKHASKPKHSPLPAHPSADAEIVATDEMVEAAARELWNDRDARMGGSWDSRDPQEVCVIQTRATARAMLDAALVKAKGGSRT